MTDPLRRPVSPEERPVVANAVGLWLVVLAYVAVDLAALPFTGFTLSLDTILNRHLMVVACLLPFWSFYTFYRFDGPLSAALGALSVAAALIPALCILTYVACALGAKVPLQDGNLAAFDDVFGFRWLTLLDWAERHPDLMGIGRWAYRSVVYQSLALVIVLSFTGQAIRLQVFVYALAIGGALCSAISAVLPALGTYAWYKAELAGHPHPPLMVQDFHVPAVLALRSGHFGILSPQNTEGIITFPSFHTVLGVLFTWAFWRTKRLRWCAVALNAVMIAATPLDGSHHLSDLLAGTAVAIMAILAAGYLHRAVPSLADRLFRSGRQGDVRPIAGLHGVEGQSMG